MFPFSSSPPINTNCNFTWHLSEPASTCALHLSRDDRKDEGDTWLYPVIQTTFTCDVAADSKSRPLSQATTISIIHYIFIYREKIEVKICCLLWCYIRVKIQTEIRLQQLFPGSAMYSVNPWVYKTEKSETISKITRGHLHNFSFMFTFEK